MKGRNRRLCAVAPAVAAAEDFYGRQFARLVGGRRDVVACFGRLATSYYAVVTVAAKDGSATEYVVAVGYNGVAPAFGAAAADWLYMKGGELKEYLPAPFILIYLLSLHRRLRARTGGREARC